MGVLKSGVFVGSEIDRLEKVIVHRPDDGISRISPKESDELLFDDIVYLPKIQEEHDLFADVLKCFVGTDNVLYVHDLILETLNNSHIAREQLIQELLEFEELPKSFVRYFTDLSNEILTEVLISGYLRGEDRILFDPIPNFIFTRDTAVVVRDHLIITKAAKAARYRENVLTRFIMHNHPYFQEALGESKILDMNDMELFPPSRKGEYVSIEGGDMMIIQDKYLLIGCSERTNEHAILSLKDRLFERGVIENVVQVNIPNDRSYMHIDTIFTQIREDVVVCYKPIVYDGMSSTVVVHNKNGDRQTYLTIKDFFLHEINSEMRFVFSGGGQSPYQEREQWTDGCNLVALKNGVGIAYDRNPKTERAFSEHGFIIMRAEDFVHNVRRKNLDPNLLENTIITIPSAELSRARGGSHCMTCPVLRSK